MDARHRFGMAFPLVKRTEKIVVSIYYLQSPICLAFFIPIDWSRVNFATEIEVQI